MKRAEYQPEQFLQRLEIRLNDIAREHPEYVNEEGYLMVGYASSLRKRPGYHFGYDIEFRLSPLGEENTGINICFATGTEDQDLATTLLESAKALIKRKGGL